jgi:hypothetical protein
MCSLQQHMHSGASGDYAKAVRQHMHCNADSSPDASGDYARVLREHMHMAADSLWDASNDHAKPCCACMHTSMLMHGCGQCICSVVLDHQSGHPVRSAYPGPAGVMYLCSATQKCIGDAYRSSHRSSAA